MAAADRSGDDELRPAAGPVRRLLPARAGQRAGTVCGPVLRGTATDLVEQPWSSAAGPGLGAVSAHGRLGRTAPRARRVPDRAGAGTGAGAGPDRMPGPGRARAALARAGRQRRVDA